MGTAFSRVKGLAGSYSTLANLSTNSLDDLDQTRHEQLLDYMDLTSDITFNLFRHRVDFVRRVQQKDRTSWEHRQHTVIQEPVSVDTSKLLFEQNCTYVPARDRSEYWAIQVQFPCTYSHMWADLMIFLSDLCRFVTAGRDGCVVLSKLYQSS
jgi:hypothetical protein